MPTYGFHNPDKPIDTVRGSGEGYIALNGSQDLAIAATTFGLSSIIG